MPKLVSGLVAMMLACISISTTKAAVAVLQRGYDAGVSGANLSETTLNTANVTASTFGLLFKLAVDDVIYAQPLYVPNVSIPNKGTHNVIYVATMSDSLYAFDADKGGTPLWSANFASRVGATPVPIARFAFAGNRNIVGNLGILSTPVIDPSTNILYLVACTLENNTMVYRLHAVDITSGAEPYGAGTVISGSFRGSTFDGRYQTQRVSLALSGNEVVFGFGAVQLEYTGGYVGWVMSYDKRTLQQSGVFATVPTGSRGGGVWQSGRPPAVDGSGYVYVFVGNAFGSGYDGVNNFSESVLKLDPLTGLKLIDWFTPSNWSALDAGDLDLTSSGPMLLPGTNLLTGGGKSGQLYLLNSGNLGKFNASDSQIIQKLQVSPGEIHGGPVYWYRSAANGGALLYDWGTSDWVKAYSFNGSTLSSSPRFQGSGTSNWPGGILTLSANGEQYSSGVLWATVAAGAGASDNPPVAGELHAYEAGDVSHELWNSTINAARDGVGSFAKFTPPMVANGKVYVASWSSQVSVYGLLSGFTVSTNSLAFGTEMTNTSSAPMLVTVTNTGSVILPVTSISFSPSGSQPFSQSNNCGSSIAVGASCKISVVFNPGALGAANATLSISSGNGAGTQTVALSGTGGAFSYSLSTISLAFGLEALNVASAPMPLTVTNTSQTALPIISIALSTSSNQPFSQTNDCGASVAAGASCTINVVFNPATAGAASATLSVNAGSGAGTQNVALSGNGAALSYSVTPGSLAFGSGALNVASAPLSLTLANTGQAALPFVSIALSTSGSQPFSQINNCGASIAVGASCTINVVFNPASTGAASATLSVTAGNGAGTQSIALSGTGVALSFSMSPGSVAFGTETVNLPSASAPVTVTNTGVLPLSISAVNLSSVSPQPFAQTNTCTSPLAAGTSCTINVMFDPATPGSTSATLSIAGGNGAGTKSVTLSGTGVPPSYGVSPASLAFGNGMLNQSSTPASVTVTNTSPVTLAISGVTLANSGSQPFAQANNCGTGIAAGASCTINVLFDPAGAGTASGTLTIATGGGTSNVDLSGTGTFNVVLTSSAPSVTVGEPATLTWSSTPGATCEPTGGNSSDNWSGTLGDNGTQAVTEDAAGNFNYSLSCAANGVKASGAVAVTDTVPTSTLSASPSTVTVGQSITLTWSSSNAASCAASGGQTGDAWNGPKPVNGTSNVTPTAAGSVTYTITCSSGSKSAASTAQVTANSPPKSGGGALDGMALLSLLALVGLRQRRAIVSIGVVR